MLVQLAKLTSQQTVFRHGMQISLSLLPLTVMGAVGQRRAATDMFFQMFYFASILLDPREDLHNVSSVVL